MGAVSPTVTPELSQGRALQEDDVGVVGRGMYTNRADGCYKRDEEVRFRTWRLTLSDRGGGFRSRDLLLPGMTLSWAKLMN